MRRIKIAERILWGLGLALIACFLAVRGYGEFMRRAELRRFATARESATNSTMRAPVVAEPSKPSSATDALPDAVPEVPFGPTALPLPGSVDTSLWSEKRLRGYEESLKGDLGAPLAVLRIPRLSLEVPVMAGTDEPQLNRGVGWIEGTADPGHGGNVGIAGHRDGYFRCLKDIKLGDAMELETVDRIEHYRVDDIRLVTPKDVSVLNPTTEPVITLVTCYPFYFVGSAPQRFIVRAREE